MSSLLSMNLGDFEDVTSARPPPAVHKYVISKNTIQFLGVHTSPHVGCFEANDKQSDFGVKADFGGCFGMGGKWIRVTPDEIQLVTTEYDFLYCDEIMDDSI